MLSMYLIKSSPLFWKGVPTILRSILSPPKVSISSFCSASAFCWKALFSWKNVRCQIKKRPAAVQRLPQANNNYGDYHYITEVQICQAFCASSYRRSATSAFHSLPYFRSICFFILRSQDIMPSIVAALCTRSAALGRFPFSHFPAWFFVIWNNKIRPSPVFFSHRADAVSSNATNLIYTGLSSPSPVNSNIGTSVNSIASYRFR